MGLSNCVSLLYVVLCPCFCYGISKIQLLNMVLPQLVVKEDSELALSCFPRPFSGEDRRTRFSRHACWPVSKASEH